MATIFRRRLAGRSIPDGAKIGRFSADNVAEIQWTDSKGNRHSGYVERDPGGELVRMTPTFFAKYRDADGIVRTMTTGCSTRATAEAWLQNVMRQEERIRAGLMSRAEVRTSEALSADVSAVIESFVEGMGATLTAKHRADTRTRLRRFVRDTEARTLRDIDQETLERWMRSQVEAGELSYRSINLIATSVKSFAKWCVRNRRMPTMQGVDVVAMLNVKLDRRRERRALTRDEFEAVCRAASPERADLYRMAAMTGLRANEIRTLRLKHVVGLGTGQARIELDARHTKGRRADSIPLHPDLEAMILRRIREKGLTPESPVVIVPDKAAIKLRTDAEKAGVVTRDDRGRVIDFHGLRKTFVTWLASSGVDMRTVQALARHSTIELTAQTYTDAGMLPTRSAMNSIPCVTDLHPTGKNQSDFDRIKPHSEIAPEVSGSLEIGIVNDSLERSCGTPSWNPKDTITSRRVSILIRTKRRSPGSGRC